MSASQSNFRGEEEEKQAQAQALAFPYPHTPSPTRSVTPDTDRCPTPPSRARERSPSLGTLKRQAVRADYLWQECVRDLPKQERRLALEERTGGRGVNHPVAHRRGVVEHMRKEKKRLRAEMELSRSGWDKIFHFVSSWFWQKKFARNSGIHILDTFL